LSAKDNTMIFAKRNWFELKSACRLIGPLV